MWHSLGKVAVLAAGTPVRATSNQSSPTDRFGCQTMFFQQIETNTGKIYVCDRADANTTTGVGVLATIPAPTLVDGVATVLPYVAVTVPSAPAALDAARFWVDVDVNDEACQISAVCN